MAVLPGAWCGWGVVNLGVEGRAGGATFWNFQH